MNRYHPADFAILFIGLAVVLGLALGVI